MPTFLNVQLLGNGNQANNARLYNIWTAQLKMNIVRASRLQTRCEAKTSMLGFERILTFTHYVIRGRSIDGLADMVKKMLIKNERDLGKNVINHRRLMTKHNGNTGGNYQVDYETENRVRVKFVGF